MDSSNKIWVPLLLYIHEDNRYIHVYDNVHAPEHLNLISVTEWYLCVGGAQEIKLLHQTQQHGLLHAGFLPDVIQ